MAHAVTVYNNENKDNLKSKRITEKIKTPTTITSDILVLTENDSKIVEKVTLTVIGNKAYREGDIFVGYVDNNNVLIQSSTLGQRKDLNNTIL